MKTLKEIMTKQCMTLTTQNTIRDAALMMKQHDIGFIPILEGKNLVGVVTDRDIVIRGLAGGKSDSASLKEIMSTGIKTVPSSTTADEAARMMAREKIRRLPVVDNGELVGVVAIGDLAVREIFVDEAGQALSEISESAKTMS